MSSAQIVSATMGPNVRQLNSGLPALGNASYPNAHGSVPVRFSSLMNHSNS